MSFGPSIPAAEDGIQYNFCKNPECSQYGLIPRGPRKHGVRGPYAFTSGGETPPLKSNHGIAEEVRRLSAYLKFASERTCPNNECDNHTVALGTPKAYRSFGKARSGVPRLQCTECRKTFSISKPTQYRRKTHQNQSIFMMLVNKVPLSRIVAMLGSSWSVLYQRIDFIHRQCLACARGLKRRLKNLPVRRLCVAVDKQEHLVKCTEREDKRNVSLPAIASADNATGYVFGVHPNFDAFIDREDVEKDAMAIGDAALAAPYRKYAHLWLSHDYLKSATAGRVVRPTGDGSLEQEIAAIYAEAHERDDIEAFDRKSGTEKLPDYGMQVRAEYTMIAHFYFLKQLMGSVEKWRFFMDQESGIRAGFLTAFHDEIKACKAEAFYVQIKKELTVDEKRNLVQEAKRNLKLFRESVPHLSEDEAMLELLKKRIAPMRELGPWKDRWVRQSDAHNGRSGEVDVLADPAFRVRR